MALSLNGTTGISGINGSAGTPALQGGDADTGTFFGTDTASLSTAGTSRLSIGSTGDINIDSGGIYYNATDNQLGVGLSSNISSKVHVEDGWYQVGSSTNTTSTNFLIKSYGYRLNSSLYGTCSIRSAYTNSTNTADLR